MACCDPDERVALGREVVLPCVLPAAALVERPRVDRAAVPLAAPLPEVPDERLLAGCLGRALDLDDCERAEPEAPSLSSCLRLAKSMMVVRPLWWRS